MIIQHIQTNTDGVLADSIKVIGIEDLRYTQPVTELHLTVETALELKRELEKKLASIPL